MGWIEILFDKRIWDDSGFDVLLVVVVVVDFGFCELNVFSVSKLFCFRVDDFGVIDNVM